MQTPRPHRRRPRRPLDTHDIRRLSATEPCAACDALDDLAVLLTALGETA
jgi:hypothetical protein